jgi:hypothetical protein
MNKKTVIASLNDIANALDKNGLFKEANEITNVMIKLSQSEAPGERGKAYRTEANITTHPFRYNKVLLKHVKGLLAKNDPASKIELKAIMDKVQRNAYNFTPYELNAFQRQHRRMDEFRNQPTVDDVMAEAFKKFLPEGVTVEGINQQEGNLLDFANSRHIGNADRFLQRTREMLDIKQPRTDRGLTGRSERLRGFGEHEKPETGYYGFGKK